MEQINSLKRKSSFGVFVNYLAIMNILPTTTDRRMEHSQAILFRLVFAENYLLDELCLVHVQIVFVQINDQTFDFMAISSSQDVNSLSPHFSLELELAIDIFACWTCELTLLI